MNPIKIYVRVIAAIMLAVFGWGFLAPPLVSSPTDIGLIVGVLVTISVPVGIYYLLKTIINQKKRKK